MLNEKFLLDSFCERGNDLTKFSELINEIWSKTKFIKMSSKDLSVLSVANESDPEKIFVYLLNPREPLPGDSYTDKLRSYCRSLEKKKILEKGDFSSLINEVEENTRVILYDDVRLLYVSSGIFSDLCQFGIKGDFIQKPSFARDMVIAQQFKSDKKITLVCKSINGINKVFAIRSGKYSCIPQSILLDIADKIKSAGLGDFICKEWEVTNFLTQIYLEFPQKAEEMKIYYDLPDDYVPGLLLTTSDTGDCSVTVNGTWRIGNSITLQNKVAKQHMGTIDVDEIVKNAESTIFAEYTKLPEALCNLMIQNITDASWDLSTAAGRKANAEAIEDTIKSVFKQLDMIKLIGKKNEKSLFTQLVDEFDPEMSFTAYDVAKSIMGIPGRLEGLNAVIERNLRRAVGQAPYLDYSADPATIVLTA